MKRGTTLILKYIPHRSELLWGYTWVRDKEYYFARINRNFIEPQHLHLPLVTSKTRLVHQRLEKIFSSAGDRSPFSRPILAIVVSDSGQLPWPSSTMDSVNKNYCYGVVVILRRKRIDNPEKRATPVIAFYRKMWFQKLINVHKAFFFR